MTDRPARNLGSKSEVETGLAHWARAYADDLQRFLAKRRLIESDVKDICQEVYLRLLRFERSEVIQNPQAYLFRVAANVAHDFRLRRPPWVSAESESLEGIADDPDLETLADATYRSRCLLRVMSALPPLPRAALGLQYRDGLSYAQIAEQLRVSRRVVKRAVAQGYALMREALLKEV